MRQPSDRNEALEEIKIRSEAAIQSLEELLPAAAAVEQAASLMFSTYLRLQNELVACVAAVARIEREGE